MKRIILASVVALAAAATMVGCSNSSNDTTGVDSTSAVPAEVADSLSIYYGRAFGANIYNYVENQETRSEKKIDRSEIIKGVQYIVGADNAEDFFTGMKIGMDIKNFIEESRQNGVEVSVDKVMKNFREVLGADSLDATTAQTDYAEFSTLMNRVRSLQMEKERVEKAKLAEEGLKAGAAFVEKAKKADAAIKTTESGLSYKIENAGTDPKVGPNDTAVVKYTGKLIDGTVFDSGEAEFAPTRVVAGFGEGMQMLGKGGKATLYIPGNLGYGEQGAGEKIGPNATLIFDIEIVSVKAADEDTKK